MYVLAGWQTFPSLSMEISGGRLGQQELLHGCWRRARTQLRGEIVWHTQDILWSV